VVHSLVRLGPLGVACSREAQRKLCLSLLPPAGERGTQAARGSEVALDAAGSLALLLFCLRVGPCGHRSQPLRDSQG